MPRGAARDDRDALDLRDGVGGQVQPVEARDALLEHQPAPQGAPHRLRLLADLLEHEVGVAPQLDGSEIPRHVVHRAQLHVRVAVDHVVPLRRQHRDVAVVEVDDGARVLEQRRRIRGDQELALADAEQHRRPLPGDDDFPGLVGRHDGQSVRADDTLERRDHAGLKGLAGRLLDQVGQRLRVGVSGEAVPVALQRRPQRVRVLDDPVVHQGEAPTAILVRVRIPLRRCSVRRPARVRDTTRPVHRQACYQVLQRCHAAGEFARDDAAPCLDREPGRIVAAVLQATEPPKQDRDRLPLPRVTDDAAHVTGP